MCDNVILYVKFNQILHFVSTEIIFWLFFYSLYFVGICRSEILHLTELLQSRAVEKPDGDASLKNEEPPSDFGRHQQFASVLLEENNNGGIRSSAVLSTPILKSKVRQTLYCTCYTLAHIHAHSLCGIISKHQFLVSWYFQEQNDFDISDKYLFRPPSMILIHPLNLQNLTWEADLRKSHHRC